MRVAIVKQSPVQASETFIRRHVESFQEEDCLVLTGAFPALTYQGNPLPVPDRRRQALRKALNLLPEVLAFRLRRAFAQEPTAQQRAVDFLMQKGVAVILAQYGPAGVDMLPVSVASGIPLCVFFHGRDAYESSTLERYGAGYRELFNHAHTVFCVSGDMREALAALGCPEERLVLNPYGPDGRFLDISPEKNSRIVAMVGRLTEKKAPHLSIMAFERALRSCPELRLEIIGDGPLRSVCQDLIKALGLEECVTLHGEATPEAILGLLARTFVFIQHSVRAASGDCEGTPVAILEASAASLPVVSTRHGGIREAVIHGRSGMLVDERDVDGMAREIVAYARDRRRAYEHGVAGREWVSRQYDLSNHIKVLHQRLREACACGRN